MDKQEIAVIGLGGMGRGIAGRLLDQGFPVAVYNRTAAAADSLVERGARRASSPAEAVTPDGIAITMVANDAALEAVTLGAPGGPPGLLDRLAPGGLHIASSTISIALARDLAARHGQAGVDYVASPVFGRPDAAASGKLWIALSGSSAARQRARPVLETLSQSIQDYGETPEAANVVKLAGNFLIASAIEALGEAFALVDKHGVEPGDFLDLIGRSIFACPIYQNYGRFIVERAFDPPGFKLELGLKDVDLALKAGTESRTPMPLGSLLHDRFLRALAHGQGGLDWTAVAVQASEDAGLEK